MTAPLVAQVAEWAEAEEWPHERMRHLACPGCSTALPSFLRMDGQAGIFELDRWQHDQDAGLWRHVDGRRRRPREFRPGHLPPAGPGGIGKPVIVDANQVGGRGPVDLPAIFVCPQCAQRVLLTSTKLLQ